MTDEMDLAPVIRSWFRETLPPAAESSHVFDAAIGEARATRQQRHPWPPLPLPTVRSSGRARTGPTATAADRRCKVRMVGEMDRCITCAPK